MAFLPALLAGFFIWASQFFTGVRVVVPRLLMRFGMSMTGLVARAGFGDFFCIGELEAEIRDGVEVEFEARGGFEVTSGVEVISLVGVRHME